MQNLDLLVPEATTAPEDRFSWATVTSVDPVRVRLDGEVDELEASVDSLVDDGWLDPTRRVWVQLHGRRVIILGQYGKPTPIPAAVVRIDSSKGTMFKADTGVNTVLNVSVFKGDQVISDLTALRAAYGPGAYLEWQWQRLNEDTYGLILASDSRLSNGGFTFTLTPADVDTKVVFRCAVHTGD